MGQDLGRVAVSFKDHAPHPGRLKGGDFASAVWDCGGDVLGVAVCVGLEWGVGFEVEGVGILVDD